MSSITLDDATPAQHSILTSASKARVDRVNVLGYGPVRSGKTTFASTFPKPIMIDTENGELTVRARITKGEIEDFPILKTTEDQVVMEILTAPEYRFKTLFKGSEWEGYKPETLIIDTISTLEGHIFDAICEGQTVAQPQWSKLKRRMMAIARKAWDCPLNTVMLAHDQSGRLKSEGMGAKAAGPLLTGTLVTQFPAQIDILLRFEQLYQPGHKEYVAHTCADAAGMPAGAQGVELPPILINPDYATLREALDKL